MMPAAPHVVGAIAPDLARAVAALAPLHSILAPLVVASHKNCVLVSLVVRDYLRALGHSAEATACKLLVRNATRSLEIHHLIVMVNGTLIDATFSQARRTRPGWAKLPAIIIVAPTGCVHPVLAAVQCDDLRAQWVATDDATWRSSPDACSAEAVALRAQVIHQLGRSMAAP